MFHLKTYWGKLDPDGSDDTYSCNESDTFSEYSPESDVWHPFMTSLPLDD